MTPAADVCPRCGRPVARTSTTCIATLCGFMDSFGCEIAADAYRRGLREGVELSREHATPTRDESGLIDETGRIDFTAVDAELTRRLSDG